MIAIGVRRYIYPDYNMHPQRVEEGQATLLKLASQRSLKTAASAPGTTPAR